MAGAKRDCASPRAHIGPVALYTQYRRYPFFADRSALIHARYPEGPILVAGCGPGYLVDELVARGRDVWGIDLDPAPVPDIVRDVARRVHRGDAASGGDLAAIRSLPGLHGRFSVAVTEDLLPMLSDAVVRKVLAELRRVSSALLHIITPGDPGDPAKIATLNWKLIEHWQVLVGGDPILDAETGRFR